MSNLSRRDPLLLQWSAMNQIAVNNCIDKSPFLPRSFPPPPSSRPPFSLRKFHKSRPSVTAMGALCVQLLHASLTQKGKRKGGQTLLCIFSRQTHRPVVLFRVSKKQKKKIGNHTLSFIIIQWAQKTSQNWVGDNAWISAPLSPRLNLKRRGHLRSNAMQKLISFVLNASTSLRLRSGYNTEFKYASYRLLPLLQFMYHIGCSC